MSDGPWAKIHGHQPKPDSILSIASDNPPRVCISLDEHPISRPLAVITQDIYYVMRFGLRRFLRPMSQLSSTTMASKWPELKDVTRLSPRVIRILGQNPNKVNFPFWARRIQLIDPIVVHFTGKQYLPPWHWLHAHTYRFRPRHSEVVSTLERDSSR